jgi:hypothetical protein
VEALAPGGGRGRPTRGAARAQTKLDALVSDLGTTRSLA